MVHAPVALDSDRIRNPAGQPVFQGRNLGRVLGLVELVGDPVGVRAGLLKVLICQGAVELLDGVLFGIKQVDDLQRGILVGRIGGHGHVVVLEAVGLA